MTPRQTAETYDKIASFWSGEEFCQSNGIAQHRRALRFVAGAMDGRARQALDVGCGSSGRMVELLLGEGFEVEGLDVSAEMVRLARERHPGVTFHRADICTWELPRRYDFISAWDSIWHAPLAEHEGILHKLCDGLTPGGVLIFTCGGLDAPEERLDELMGEPVTHATLGLPRLLELVAGAGCVCRHLEYDQHPELHVYFIVQKSGEGNSDREPGWQPPTPEPLGWKGMTDAEIKDHAQGWVGQAVVSDKCGPHCLSAEGRTEARLNPILSRLSARLF